MVANCF